MIKKIVSWFAAPKELNVEPFYRTREVWTYQHIDPQTRRVSVKPVLVFRKASDGMFWGLLLTKTTANGRPLYIPRLRNGKKASTLSQMRTLKASRLVRRVGTAGEREFGSLNNAIIRLLNESAPVKRPVQKTRVVRPRPIQSPIYILQPQRV
jgi:hypothetical protein